VEEGPLSLTLSPHSGARGLKVYASPQAKRGEKNNETMKRTFTLFITLLAPLSALHAAAAPRPKPHLVFTFVDGIP
jgi:hypothetical protein